MEININKGMKKYDKFVKKILGHTEVMTPRTQTLEVIALLKESHKDFMGICLAELQTNFQDDYRLEVINNKLYRVFETEERESY